MPRRPLLRPQQRAALWWRDTTHGGGCQSARRTQGARRNRNAAVPSGSQPATPGSLVFSVSSGSRRCVAEGNTSPAAQGARCRMFWAAAARSHPLCLLQRSARALRALRLSPIVPPAQGRAATRSHSVVMKTLPQQTDYTQWVSGGPCDKPRPQIERRARLVV